MIYWSSPSPNHFALRVKPLHFNPEQNKTGRNGNAYQNGTWNGHTVDDLPTARLVVKSAKGFSERPRSFWGEVFLYRLWHFFPALIPSKLFTNMDLLTIALWTWCKGLKKGQAHPSEVFQMMLTSSIYFCFLEVASKKGKTIHFGFPLWNPI